MSTAVILALSVVTIAVVVALLSWGSRGANRITDFFFAALTTYLLFDDRAAGRAAGLASAIAVGDLRDKMTAVLVSLSQLQAPASAFLLLLFLRADATGTSELNSLPVAEATETIRRRAVALWDEIMTARGTLSQLRQALAAEAPEYERALGGITTPDASVFRRLDPVAMERLRRLYA